MNRPPHSALLSTGSALWSGSLRGFLAAGLCLATWLGAEIRIIPAQDNVVPGPKGAEKATPEPPAANPPPKGGLFGDLPPVDKNEPEEDDANLGLPAGFVPKGEIAPSFNIKDEWTFTPFGGDTKALRIAGNRWVDMNNKGIVPNAADRNIIEEIVRQRLSQFTVKEARDFKDKNIGKGPVQKGVVPAFQNREQLILAARRAYLNSKAPGGQSQFHEALLESIVKDAPNLFKYHFIARLNAAILLAQLNSREEFNGQPEVPYIPANVPLLKLLEPPKPKAKPEDIQPEAVKVWAVQGLVRIAAMPDTGELNVQIRHRIVEALINELENSGNSHYWYQVRLVEGLGLVKYSRDRSQRATIPQALLQVLRDPKRKPVVRAAAAQALGRIQFDNKVNVSLIAFEIARFAADIGKAATPRPPLKRPPESDLRFVALRLYMAFMPVNGDERSREYGLLNEKKSNKNGVGTPPFQNPTVKAAYRQILPMVNALINDNYAPLENISKKIEAWTNENPPKDYRVSPEMPRLARQQARRPPPNGPAEG